ncbi:hypothetical protein G4B88_019052 [Cannabis sativa]|uniref:RING-type domain-containing protein n=1 Tax=Cannabis sativa TaxID=3483 RepID=A0A7J6H107_CANSA|nr:hypothetical protein G4B88_019052 [Cannabis sativa]
MALIIYFFTICMVMVLLPTVVPQSHVQNAPDHQDNAPAVDLPSQNAFEQIAPVLTIDAFPEDEYSYGENATTEVEECPICLGEYEEGDTVRKFPCGHVFHPECMQNILNCRLKKCPNCRFMFA